MWQPEQVIALHGWRQVEFPKQFQADTDLSVDWYPCYRHHDNGRTGVVSVGPALLEVDIQILLTLIQTLNDNNRLLMYMK